MNVNDIRLKKGERGIIIGRAGTGKSHLAQFLIPENFPLTILDPKRGFEYRDDDCKIYRTPQSIRVWKPKRCIYQPIEDDLDNLAAYNDVLKWSYKYHPRFVYIDDMVGIMNRQQYPRYVQICYQMGRQLDVRCLAATQRPAFVPGFLMSESIKIYAFHLHYPSDVKKVQEMVPGYNPDLLLDNPHAFYYYDHRLKTAKRLVMPAQLPIIERG